MKKNPVVEQAEQLMEPYLTDLEAMVNIDSGTYTKAGVDRVGAYLQERFRAFGFATYFEEQELFGNNLVAIRKGASPAGARILLVGHMDTVFPEGEAQRRPFAIRQQHGMRVATGPGVLDMKAGLLIGLYGVHLLSDEAHYQSVTFVCNTDEEIGSPASRTLIQQLARQSDAVIVLEPGRALNHVVSSRRCCGFYRVEVRGVAAHAGIEPQLGRNAILELAHQVQAMQALHGTVPGTSVNVTLIQGGQRTNVIPDYAYCDMDVRASNTAGVKAIETAMRKVAAQTVVTGTTVTLSGEMTNAPFEHSTRNESLIQLAKEAGSELGLQIEDLASGGASDANHASAVGVPTIDGLGAGGGHAHNPDEYIELDYLPTRIALLTGLVKRVGDVYQHKT